MKLSTGVKYLGGKDLFENLALNRAVGFKHFDQQFPEWSAGTGYFSDDFDGYVKLVKGKMAEIGVDYVQAHAPMGKPLMGDDAAKKLIKDTKTCIRACHALGIPGIVVHSGYLWDISKEECFDLNKKFFNDLLAEAEKYGVYIFIENFNKMVNENRFWIDNATDLLALIEYIDHPLCHACWDAGHANLQDMPQHEELAILGSHVMATHVQDNKGDNDTHLVPYFGTLNLDSMMQGLINIGYKGAFNFEVDMMLTDPSKRRPFEGEKKLPGIPQSVRIAVLKMIYEIGKTTLEAYGQFED